MLNRWSIAAKAIFVWGGLVSVGSAQFQAQGPQAPEQMEPAEQGVVEVRFDSLPTLLRFNAPAYPCMVTENNIQYSDGFAETYDPRIDPDAVETSFEPAFDDDNMYARMWIESQTAARIIVRVRGALVSDIGKHIAHSDFESDSPHGEGDWVDEWYTIYPDGTYARHVKIYTGLAAQSLPFGYDREPPRVIHEFMEGMVLGRAGRSPNEDIHDNALTLIRTLEAHNERVIPGGSAKEISFATYPTDFAEFSNANIWIVNLKSRYRPFTIAMPYGIQTQPYKRDDANRPGFQVWGNPPQTPYTVPLGHMINYAPYRKTDRVIEQVYLSGFFDSETATHQSLVDLSWSWVAPPKVDREREAMSYETRYYDPAQRAYTFDWTAEEDELVFELQADDDYYGIQTKVINPAIVVWDWGQGTPEVTIDGKVLVAQRDYQWGLEDQDLVLWIPMVSSEAVEFTITKRP